MTELAWFEGYAGRSTDEVDAKKEAFIADIERRLEQSVEPADVFTIRWRVV